jgi:hypothetical protein
MSQIVAFLFISGLIFMLKSMGPDITASTKVGCTEISKICVESTKSTSGHTKTSIEIRLK